MRTMNERCSREVADGVLDPSVLSRTTLVIERCGMQTREVHSGGKRLAPSRRLGVPLFDSPSQAF